MNKLKDRRGFSLIEVLAAIGIMVILIMGMDAGMKAATRAYSDAVFESNSASLAGILNTSVGDILRYSEDVIKNPSIANPSVPGFQDKEGNTLTSDRVDFVFSNFEYGVRNGYFSMKPQKEGNSSAVLQIEDLQNNPSRPLVNNGAYPELEIDNFRIEFEKNGNYFDLEYDILDMEKEGRSRHVEHTVRLLNPKG